MENFRGDPTVDLHQDPKYLTIQISFNYKLVITQWQEQCNILDYLKTKSLTLTPHLNALAERLDRASTYASLLTY